MKPPSGDFALDPTIAQSNGPISVCSRLAVMSDQDDGASAWLGKPPQQLKDISTRCRVEVARRFVTKDQFWFRRERAGNSDALGLTAGHLGRAMPGSVRKPDPFENGPRLPQCRFTLLTRQHERQRYILLGSECGQQIKELEDKPNPTTPQQRPFAIG